MKRDEGEHPVEQNVNEDAIERALTAMRNDSPDAGHWSAYSARLQAKLFRRRARAWQRGFVVLCAAAACVAACITLSALSGSSHGPTRADLASYFESTQKQVSDRQLFDALEATYPQQVEWVGWGYGQTQIGLRAHADRPANDARILVGIETVVLRTAPDGTRDALITQRLAALDGATTEATVPVEGEAPGVLVRTVLRVADGRIRGAVEFACTTQSGTMAIASTDDVVLPPGEPMRVLTVNLGESQYTLVLRARRVNHD